jgi:hypothetical protein
MGVVSLTWRCHWHVSHYWPVTSPQEMEIMATFNMPYLGSVARIRQAQDLADNYRNDFLESGSLKKALAKVEAERKHHLHLNAPPEGCEATVVLMRRKCAYCLFA